MHPTFLGSRIDEQKTAPSSGPNKISLSRQHTFPFRCLHHLFSHSGARPDRNVIHLLMRISPRQLVCNFPFHAVHLHTTDPANRFTRAPTSGVRLIAHFNFLWYISSLRDAQPGQHSRASEKLLGKCTRLLFATVAAQHTTCIFICG